MADLISPFLETKYGWPYGSSGWNLGADENWLKTGFMFDGNVDAVSASLPTLSNGVAHFLTSDNRFYFAVGGQWYSSPCPKWFIFKVRSTGAFYQFNGTSAVQIDSPTQVDSRLDAVELALPTLSTITYTDGVMDTHEAAVDPHPQYMTEAESDAKYLQITNTQIFGQRTITGNTSVIAKTAAVDATLSTNSDYTQVTGIFAVLPDGIVSGVTQQLNSMTVQHTGPYEIKIWASMTSSLNNTNVAYKFAVNGVISTQRRPRAKIGSGGDRVNVSAHGYINLTAGDILTLWIASDQTANITIEDAVFSVVYLGGLS